MSIILPIPLTEHVLGAVNDIRRSIMPARLPNYLYHYTRGEGFQGIVKSRNLRARCAVSLNDKSEIRHGVEILTEIIHRRLARKNGLRHFTNLVLTQLKSEPLKRIDKTYVACFCEEQDVGSQWERYGPYCLRFPIDKDSGPQLRPRVRNAFIQLVKVVYKNRRKRSTITTMLERITEALESRSTVHGDVDGPWTTSVVDIITFSVSELVLDILVSFKSEEYKKELEWRLVVRPKQELCGSDRLSPDQGFNVVIMTGDNGKKYIELFVPPPTDLFMPSARSAAPFDSITIGPCAEAEGLRKLAQRVLSQNCLQGVPVELSKPERWLKNPWLAQS